jgi:hypothetical protein
LQSRPPIWSGFFALSWRLRFLAEVFDLSSLFTDLYWF